MTGNPSENRRRRRRLEDVALRTGVALAVVFAALALAVSVVGLVVGLHAISETDRRGRIDTLTDRQARWRICERANRDRAFAQTFFDIGTPPRTLAETFIPIVDCDPNLVGRSAVGLPIDAQRAYVRRFQAGDLAPLPEPPGAIAGDGEPPRP